MGLSDRVSLSKSALLLSPCLTWAGPGARWYEEDKVDPEDLSKRDKGTLFHRIIAAGINQTRAFGTAPDDVWGWYEHARLYVEQVLLPRCESYQTEVCVGINWSTGQAEVFPDVAERNYPDRPGWQFGTADIVCVLRDGSLLIADWKTGGNEGATEQLTSLACGFQRCMTGTDGFRPVKILCLQVNDDGVWPHESDVSPAELTNHWESMRMQWEDVVKGTRLGHQPGIHCTTLYCPHLGHCDAIAGVVAEAGRTASPGSGGPLVPPSALLRKVTDRPVTDEEAGETMALISAAKRQLKYAEEKMKAHIAQGGQVVCGAYEWANGTTGHRWRKR